MPESVFDYGAINAQMKGDDWYAPKRDMIDAAQRAGRCVPNDCCEQACDPVPCTTAPTPPPLPCGQAANSGIGQQAAARGLMGAQQERAEGGMMVGHPAPPMGQIPWEQMQAQNEIGQQMGRQLRLKNVPPEVDLQRVVENPASACHALIQVIEKNLCEETQKLHERIAKLNMMVWRNPREQNDHIRDEEARYQLATAPMRRQREWLLQQLVNITPPPAIIATPVDYACEPVREVDMRAHKRGTHKRV